MPDRPVETTLPDIPSATAPRWSVAAALACLGCVALAMLVHHRALGAFFAPDDLLSIERALGRLGDAPLPYWRLLAGPGYFGLATRLFGVDPRPYHLVNLLLHALDVTLLFALARRWSGSTLAATLAAGLFGASRLHGVTLLQAVGIGELLALALTLAAMLAFDATRTRRVVLACALFAAALLAKENVLLLPLVLLAPLTPLAPLRRRIPAVAAMLAVGALHVALFVGASGTRTVLGGEAYATAFGANLPLNLATYLAWLGDFRSITPDLLGGVTPSAWPAGLAVAAALAAAAALAWRRPAVALTGLAWFVLALAPVLPYLHHSYATYLYPALPGVGLTLGAAFAAVTAPWRARPTGARAVGIAAALLLLAYATAGATLEKRRWETLTPHTRLPMDPTLRKSELARNMTTSLTTALAGRRAKLVILMPTEAAATVDIASGARRGADAALPDLRVAVLDGGRALEVLVPGADSVAFVPSWTPAYRDFDLVATTVDGIAIDFGSGVDGHLRLARAYFENGQPRLAIEHLDAVIPSYPDDPRLARARAHVAETLAGR